MRSKSADLLISIDGIIIDENAQWCKITVPKKLAKQFRPLLAQGQGSVYIFTNLIAVDTKQRTNIYHHQDYMLQFQPNSKVHRLDSRGDKIPRYAFNCCPFDQLSSKDITSKPLLEQTQELQLWGEHGETFNEAEFLEKTKQGIIVAIFAGLTAGSFKGVTQASSSSATQILIDLDIPQITEFCTSYKWEAPSLQQHAPQVLQLSPIQAAGQIYTLDKIIELPATSFQGGATYSSIAKISVIVPCTKWYYKACRSCKVGYGSISEEPRCDCPAPQPMPM
ncbi:hypothetical protein PVAP13_8KG213703 [Panicum virgatum]|uniref:Uncharacterized protein n=1 Tax=Panicum virgatum TaxID=38727 RepID=A0A8T0PHN4_PANVG|nr:hypothetical protein PVAP13_8KG213703 [Panicum virgatum]